jgi:hypothetical protein
LRDYAVVKGRFEPMNHLSTVYRLSAMLVFVALLTTQGLGQDEKPKPETKQANPKARSATPKKKSKPAPPQTKPGAKPAPIKQPAAKALTAEQLDPTHLEVDSIDVKLEPDGKIETMAMNAAGDLLVGVSWPNRSTPTPGQPKSKSKRLYAVKIISTDGKNKIKATWPMDIVVPKMIHGLGDGNVFIGGHGVLAIYDPTGGYITSIEVGDAVEDPDAKVSGVTANKDYIFIAFGYGGSLRATEDVVRFDHELTAPKLIVKKQFGCCDHLDLDVKGDTLLVAENSRFRVNLFTLEGEMIDRWGKRDRKSIAGFSACCNPVNFDMGPDGFLYTAESGIGRIKKYSKDGELLGVVGYVNTFKFQKANRTAAISCYIPIEISKDGKRFYVMDVRANIIRVLVPKAEAKALLEAKRESEKLESDNPASDKSASKEPEKPKQAKPGSDKPDPK